MSRNVERALKVAIAVLVMAPIFAAVLVAHCFAHDAESGWSYPVECCSSADCMEIAGDAITPLPQGWGVRATGEVVSYEKTRRSPDGRYHRCTGYFANEHAPDKTICLFTPDMVF